MANEPQNLQEWERLLSGLNFDGLASEKIGPTEMEFDRPTSKEAATLKGKKVFVQKLVSEIWIYTDINGKSFGHKGSQDIIVVGEIDYEEALKLMGKAKARKPRNSE
jgi:hypothetical protein